MTRFLAHMSRSDAAEAFRRALPILGRDGTLFDILPESPAAGHVRAKTGTLIWYDRLIGRFLLLGKGLAGYIDTRDGRRFAFAAYLNDVPFLPGQQVPWDAVHHAGEALGRIAEAAFLHPPEPAGSSH